MPPTKPIKGRIKAFAKDAAGDIYEIGGGASNLDALTDVDVSTTPPADGQTIVFDDATDTWVPGPGGTDEVMILGALPTDPANELWVDLNATQGPVTGTLQGGPGITIETSADGTVTEVRVNTGDGVIVNVNGVSVNVDGVTIKVNAQDQLEVIGAGTDFVAGPGMVVDDTQPPVVLFQVDTGEGIVTTPAGIAVNTDNLTIQVDPLTDKVTLIAGIDHLSDVDTSTTPPTVGQTLTWEDGLRQWIPTTLASAATIKPGPGINVDDQTNPAEILVSVDPGAAIIHTADGIAVNTDGLTVTVNAQDQLETISNFVAGPGVVVDSVTNPPQTLIQVDTGAGIVNTPDGVAVNVDTTSVYVGATDQVSVNTGEGIVVGPNGIAVNADLVTLAVDPVDDKLKLIAPINELSDVDTVTVAPTAQDSLIWDSTLVPPTWRPGVPITDGLTPKTPARATTTGANILLDGSVTVLDGITLVAGDRVLVKDQTTAVENGVYDVAAGPWARSVDSNTEGSIVNGSAVFVSEGALYQGVNFVASTIAAESPWTPDADQSFWFIFSSALDLTAGDGLVLVGRDIRVGAGEGIHVDPDSVRVDLGAGIVHTPDGIAANVDMATLHISSTDKIAVDLGEGLVVGSNGVKVNTDDSTVHVSATDQVAVNLGEGLVAGPNGVRVNTDDLTVTVNSSDQLVVDLGEGIVSTPDGIAVNTGLGLEVVADRLRVNRTITDSWYTIVRATEPIEYTTWIDTSVVTPIP